jgi:acetyltransferase-like isoleucine patch superfamily enzyme
MKKILFLLLLVNGMQAQTSLQDTLQKYYNGLCCVKSTQPSGVAPTVQYSKNTFLWTQGEAVNECPIVTGTAPVALSISPSLPAGLTFNTSTGCITGTPTTSISSTPFVVTATNSFGSGTDNFNAIVSASITPLAPTIEYTESTFAFNTSDAVNICPTTLTGDPTIVVTVSPSLPSGLTLNSSTGCITGTPTSTSANTSFTFTATNSAGSDTDVATIGVVNLGVITITGGIANGHFTDLASAIDYVELFESLGGAVSPTDVSLTGDIFRFTYPAGTSFSGGPNFLSKGFLPAPTSSATIKDSLGRIVEYATAFMNNSGNNVFGNNVNFTGTNNFQESTGNNTFGNGCIFAQSDFGTSTGNNTFGNDCEFGLGFAGQSTGDFTIGENAIFANNAFDTKQSGDVTIGDGAIFGENAFNQLATGTVSIRDFGFNASILPLNNSTNMFQNVSNPVTLNLTGDIGSTDGDDFGTSGFVNNSSFSNITINALVSKETSNGGGIEGDLANLINNVATVNFILP